MKLCSKCGETKALSHFNKRLDGLQAICKVCHREYSRLYYKENRVKLRVRQAGYYLKIREMRLVYLKEYRKNNRLAANRRAKEYYHAQKGINKFYIMSKRIRTLIWAAWTKKDKVKSFRTEEILGCSILELISHLKETWKINYPKRRLYVKRVHIDHIIPLATASTEEELLRLNHFSNLQLLLAADNLKKSNNLDYYIRKEATK